MTKRQVICGKCGKQNMKVTRYSVETTDSDGQKHLWDEYTCQDCGHTQYEELGAGVVEPP